MPHFPPIPPIPPVCLLGFIISSQQKSLISSPSSVNIPLTSKCPPVDFTRWKPGSRMKILLPLSAGTHFLPLSVVWRRLLDAFFAPHCYFRVAFLLMINSSFESEVIKPSNNLLLSPCCCHCPWFLKHLSAWFTVTDSNVVYHTLSVFIILADSPPLPWILLASIASMTLSSASPQLLTLLSYPALHYD